MDLHSAATNLISKLMDIPGSLQAGGAERILFGIEHDRLMYSLNAIPEEIVREAESGFHSILVVSGEIEFEFDHESHPSDYGLSGFDSWEDFDSYNDACEAKCSDGWQ